MRGEFVSYTSENMTERFLLLALFFASLLLWVILNGRAGKYDFKTVLDRFVPFVPLFALIYLSAYALVPLGIAFLIFSPYGTVYLVTINIVMFSAAVSWFLFPTISFRPDLPEHGILFRNLVFRAYEGNTHGNGFPSSHVMTSFVTAYYLAFAYPSAWYAFYGMASLIALSTMTIKQHRVADVLAGMLWVVVVIALVQYGAAM